MKLSQQNKVSKERKRLENLKIKVNFIVIKEKKKSWMILIVMNAICTISEVI